MTLFAVMDISIPMICVALGIMMSLGIYESKMYTCQTELFLHLEDSHFDELMRHQHLEPVLITRRQLKEVPHN